MAKYIDAGLIRQEIESRMGDCDANSKNPNQLLWAELASLIPFIDSLQQERPSEKTCKKCGFYENNCPYIRGKFIPYPSKVCKDYTYSVIKEQEQPSEDLGEAAEKFVNDWAGLSPTERRIAERAYLAGAEWRYQKDRGEFAELKAMEWFDGYSEGIAKGEEQMLRIAKNRYEQAMTFVTGNSEVDQAIQKDRLSLVKIIEEGEE